MKLKYLLLSTALLNPLSSQAVTLDFDDVEGRGARFSFSYSDQGYTLEAWAKHFNSELRYTSLFSANTGRSTQFNATETYLGENTSRSLMIIRNDNNALFDLNNIDLGSASRYETQTITVSGLDSGGNVIVSATFASQHSLLQHAFVGFVGLSSVEIFSESRFSIDDLDVSETNVAPQFSCVGFNSPMGNGPVKVKKNRVLPLKAQIFDEDSFVVGDQDIVAAPVLTVLYSSDTSSEAIDVSDDAFASGQGSEGNLFSYDADTEQWQFNLKTKNYSAAGTYSLSLTSGDGLEYGVGSTCGGSFVIK